MASRRGAIAERKRFNASKALRYRLRGLSNQEIADVMRASVSDVNRSLAGFDAMVGDEVQAFRENEPELLDVLRMKLVAHMNRDEVLAKSSLNNAAFALSKVHEAARLIRNQSTANIGVRTSVVMGAHGAVAAEDSDESDEA